jgi:hypothetical protein
VAHAQQKVREKRKRRQLTEHLNFNMSNTSKREKTKRLTGKLVITH